MQQEEHDRAARTLLEWYDRHPAVLRLWAYRPASADDALRVVLVLQPSADGGETSPTWMARRSAWGQELQARLPRLVQLECLDAMSLGEPANWGSLVTEVAWRDATVASV